MNNGPERRFIVDKSSATLYVTWMTSTTWKKAKRARDVLQYVKSVTGPMKIPVMSFDWVPSDNTPDTLFIG